MTASIKWYVLFFQTPINSAQTLTSDLFAFTLHLGSVPHMASSFPLKQLIFPFPPCFSIPGKSWKGETQFLENPFFHSIPSPCRMILFTPPNRSTSNTYTLSGCQVESHYIHAKAHCNSPWSVPGIWGAPQSSCSDWAENDTKYTHLAAITCRNVSLHQWNGRISGDSAFGVECLLSIGSLPWCSVCRMQETRSENDTRYTISCWEWSLSPAAGGTAMRGNASSGHSGTCHTCVY